MTELKPTRNAATLKFSIEDAARIPGLESALTRDLRMALTEGIDRAIFIGDAGANEDPGDITGLRTAGITETTITQVNKVKGPETLTAFTGMVDGIHANMLSDLNVVAAVGAFRLWEATVFNTAADNMTLAAFLRKAGLAWMARGSIEDNTVNNDFAAFVGRKRGIEGAAVAAVWEAGGADPRSIHRRGQGHRPFDDVLALELRHSAHRQFPARQIRHLIRAAMEGCHDRMGNPVRAFGGGRRTAPVARGGHAVQHRSAVPGRAAGAV